MFNRTRGRLALAAVRLTAITYIWLEVPGWDRLPWAAGYLADDYAVLFFLTRTVWGLRIWGR